VIPNGNQTHHNELANMTLREATNADTPAIRDLVFGVLESCGLKADPATTDNDLENIEQNYLQSGGAFTVLEEAGRIVGSYGLLRIDDDECELRKMYLHAEYRGRGLGKQLLEHALERAKQLEFRAIRLETASVLKEAIALYRAYGFEPYAASHLSARCDQAYRQIIQDPK
jgi:putative acetyltransferase